ncbi:MAG: hypothetical protein ABMA01_05420, partial [Chthoniobacteraceae bacterium]
MKRLLLSVFTCIVMLAVVDAAAAPMASSGAETLPKQKILSLEVVPVKVVLAGKFEAAQVLVNARLQSGEIADVTRFATLRLDGDCAQVFKTGRIESVKNGTANLVVEVAGQKANAPVEVSGITDAVKVDFIRDVNPVMTKLGCNAGTCHGAKDGKYGFKLSLRGYDPIYDVRSLKDDLAGRRLNVASPDDSLMLL